MHQPSSSSTENNSGRLPSLLLDILLIPVVAFFITLKFHERFNVNLYLIAVSLLYVFRSIFLDARRRVAAQFNLLDVSVSLVVVSEVCNYFLSTYRLNSFFSLVEILFLFLFYWLVRFHLTREYQRTALFIFLTLWGVYLAGFAFDSVHGLHGRLRALGFADITNFRNYIYMLNPIGLSIGEWCTVLFLLLPFPLILIVKYRARRFVSWPLTLVVAAIMLTLMLTFIRGVYIAAAVFFIVGSALFLGFRIFPARKIFAFNSAVIILLLIGIVPVWRPALTTLSLFSTTSQVRSFEGRRQVWKDSLGMIEDHPLSGVGASNFTMQYVAYRAQGAEAAFALRPFNYLLHIVLEKGLLGLFTYSLMFFSFLFVAYKKLMRLRGDVYRQSVILLFVTALVSILVRDMSESSIAVNRGVGILLWFIFAHVAQSEEEVNS